jgi:hypothetical protein
MMLKSVITLNQEWIESVPVNYGSRRRADGLAQFESLTFETVSPSTRCPKTHREHELSARAELKLSRPENHGL